MCFPFKNKHLSEAAYSNSISRMVLIIFDNNNLSELYL